MLFFYFLFIKNHDDKKILCSITVSVLIIIINISCTTNLYLIMISEDHVTLKTAVMMLKIHLNKLQFNTYSYRKHLF